MEDQNQQLLTELRTLRSPKLPSLTWEWYEPDLLATQDQMRGDEWRVIGHVTRTDNGEDVVRIYRHRDRVTTEFEFLRKGVKQ